EATVELFEGACRADLATRGRQVLALLGRPMGLEGTHPGLAPRPAAFLGQEDRCLRGGSDPRGATDVLDDATSRLVRPRGRGARRGRELLGGHLEHGGPLLSRSSGAV